MKTYQRYIILTIGCILGFLLLKPSTSSAFMAGRGQRLMTNTYNNTTYSFGSSTIFLKSEGKEYVYAPALDGMKISDLRWEAKNVIMAGAELSMQYGESFTLNGGWWRRISSQTGTMTDDDWNAAQGLQETTDPRVQTHFSESQSELTEGAVYDINGCLSVMKLMQNNLHIRAIAGYKKETWKWEASDGYWIYVQEVVEQNGDAVVGVGSAGSLEGVGIRYKQKMTIPYIGVGMHYRGQRFQLEAHAIYSNRVELDANDEHLQRNFTTEDSFSDGEYWAIGLNHTWNLSPKMFLVGSIEHEKVQTIRGDSKWIFPEEEREETVEDGAGAGYHATTAALTVVYIF